ncbi:histone-lysine N-methyltransferase SETD1B [Drosophila teissieri]|uniref:histone-lysine N-methyltransferase SETD1B n=1 Tax=Drosophila teissieri TaxID=7243 RepID=UPI001CBA5B9F|nr:histone-lysine N-methyltransferase SETD1B [Drosophila teissieri]
MSKLGAILVVGLCLFVAVALAEPRLQQVQGRNQVQGQRAQQHPYLFLSIPKGRANAGAVVQGFEIVEEEEDDLQDDDQHDDELEDDDELEHQLGLKFARSGVAFRQSHDDVEQDDDQDQEQDQVQDELPKKQMLVNRDQAGAIMVPDGIIEIEGQSVLDEKTGKAALLVPRAALDAIPDGAVVALMERSASSSDEIEEERANRVVVRRRKNNGRRNIRRRGISNNNVRRRRRPAQRRRRAGGNRRRNVRVIRPQGGNRRRGNQRRRGQVVLQG